MGYTDLSSVGFYFTRILGGLLMMRTVKDKQVLVGADFAGFPLKEQVVKHLKSKGWNITDIGVKSADEKNPEMFHRIGLKNWS